MELLTAAQMRAIEQAAIDSGSVTGLDLMERAGRGVVAAIFEEWPELAAAPHKAVILCGPGNNGGDGFVVARLLREWGWELEVFLYGDAAKLPPDAKTNYTRWCAFGRVQELRANALPEAHREGPAHALWIDALFGTGLTRALEGPDLIAALQCLKDASMSASAHCVAVDIPSGICADSGRMLVAENSSPRQAPATNHANLTVTFHRPKLGHVLADGPVSARRLHIAGIGLPDAEAPQGREAATGTVRWGARPSAEALQKTPNAHKYAHGHALLLSGPMGHSGAARLAARGALRVGAGLVTVAAPGSAITECAAQLTAIMLRRCDDAAGLSEVLEDKRLNALCLGPGLGVGQGTRDLVLAALEARRPLVLDADALTSFVDDPEALFDRLYPDAVLTPHAGEFARLFPDLAERLSDPVIKGPAYSKVDATRAAADRAGCTLLFKGPDTVIAAPDGRCALHPASYDRAAPWLATAGSGDVLAGMITGLLARGLCPMQAAESAAWLHVEAARRVGPGLIAEDLPEALPGVFRDLGF